jgi:5-hydroxyisourate hydrolase
MPRVSTHVLDTAHGRPADGIRVELHLLVSDERRMVAERTTNAEGRTNAPLLSGDRLEPGVYELTFYAGDYFKRVGVVLTNPPFLDTIVVRFGISDVGGHYHVPLLLSPYGYSTYRGT